MSLPKQTIKLWQRFAGDFAELKRFPAFELWRGTELAYFETRTAKAG